MIVHFAFAGLVALTLQDLLDRPPGAAWPRWPLTVLVAGSAFLTGVSVLGGAWLASRGIVTGPPALAILGLAFPVATAASIAMAARGSRRAIGLVILIAAVDLACRGLPYAYAQRPIPIRAIAGLMGRPSGAVAGDLVHPGPALDDMNRYVMRHLRSQLAYLGLSRSSVLDPDTLVTQRIAGVKWTLAPGGWAPVEATMPRVRFATEWRVSGDMRADVGAIDIARTALVDASPGTATGAPGEARLTEERAGRFRIETRAATDQLLILTERFHTGWTAEIDGAPVSTRRVYGDYLGCLVPAGSHTVSFVFAPQSWRYGVWLTLAGLGLTVLGAVFVGRAR